MHEHERVEILLVGDGYWLDYPYTLTEFAKEEAPVKFEIT